MALIRPGPIVRKLSGSVEDVTFSPGPGGAIARQKTHTCNPESQLQFSARSELSEIAKLWQSLTDAQHLAWKATSYQHPYTNRIGHQHHLSGYQFFVKLNTTLLEHGQPTIANPPSSFDVPPITTAAVMPLFSGETTTDLELIWNSTTPIAAITDVESTGRYSFGYTPDSHRLQNIATYPAGTTPNQNAGTLWATPFGDLPTQPPYKIWFRFTPIGPTNGWKGCPINYVLAIATSPPSPPPTPGTSCSSATAIAAATPYVLEGPTLNPGWFKLPVDAGNFYTIAWTQANSGGTATLQAGPSCASLTTLYTFALQDSVLFEADPGVNYYIATTTWPTSTTLRLIFNPLIIEGPPTITSIEPNYGAPAGGQYVTIHGTNFRGAKEVDFGTTACQWFRVKSNWRIVALTPPLTPGAYDVTVHGEQGCSAVNENSIFTATWENPGGLAVGGYADTYTAIGRPAEQPGGGDAGGAADRYGVLTQLGGGDVGGQADKYGLLEQLGGEEVGGQADKYGLLEQLGGANVGGNSDIPYGLLPTGGGAAAGGQTDDYGQLEDLGGANIGGKSDLYGEIEQHGGAALGGNSATYAPIEPTGGAAAGGDADSYTPIAPGCTQAAAQAPTLGTGSGTTITVTWANPTTAGNIIAVALYTTQHIAGGGPTVPAGWTRLIGFPTGSAASHLQIFFMPSAPSTTSLAITAAIPTITAAWVTFEFTPGSLLGTVDQSTAVSGSSASPSATTGTTATNCEIGLAAIANNSAATYSATTPGWNTADIGGLVAAYQIITTTGTQTFGATMSTSAPWLTGVGTIE